VVERLTNWTLEYNKLTPDLEEVQSQIAVVEVRKQELAVRIHLIFKEGILKGYAG
jgi:hypothetical protein